MSRVQELLKRKREEVALRKRDFSASVPPDDRRLDWRREGFRIFAEIKRASLSAGDIRKELSPPLLAGAYKNAGVAAVSVLTEQNYFKGSLENLRDVRSAVEIPILQKDFIVDEFQIREAKVFGADFVLLIAKFLQADELSAMLSVCEEIRMNVLVEITNQDDLRKLHATPEFLGVNSRNLETLEIDKTKFRRLRKQLPDSFLVAESGINDLSALQEVIDLGYNGALIGEHFLRAEDPGAEAARFVEFASKHKPNVGTRVKICGITNQADAIAAVEAGADALGFIFADSPRRVSPNELARFRANIPDRVLTVGVFKGQNAREIEKTMQQFSLDVSQIYDETESPGTVWRAKMISGQRKNEFLFDERATIIWDIKAERSRLPDFWRHLKHNAREVFALAGGLDPENVTEAVSICRPFWVDVARGVEKEPGKKDINRLYSFVDAVKQRMKDEG